MSLFCPDLMLDRITSINEELLKKQNIYALILDVDNTLTEHGSQFLRPAVAEWLNEMKKIEIKMVIVSNNTRQRVEPFANQLGLDFVSMSCKPLTVGMTKAQRIFALPPSQIAVVGDQLFTDVVGGNLKGMFTIMVEPFSLEKGALFFFKRSLEKPFVSHYHKRGATANGTK